ncbi:hypothetical protein UPYG_G00337860 [Umbra pygmaea]|uniref:Ig-like domain-containing protein n=1 Tax=Umbra pygmaea TaxID=75934 RepID=A0ABD0VWZ8_UMBPY
MTGALLLWLCWSYGLNGKHIITQTPEVEMVKTGGTVTLKCNLKELITYCYSVTWMKVDPRTKTITLIQNSNIDDDSSRKNSIADKQCSVTITDIKVRDSGMYYCSVVQSDMIHTGSGSKVIVVTEKERSGNSTDPRPSRSSHHQTAMAPPSLSSWTDNSDSATEFTRNQILVQAEEWDRGAECTCVVEFEGHNITKTVQRRNDSNSLCSVLLYGVCAAAVLVVILAVAIAVCLHHGQPVVTDADARITVTGNEDKRHLSGRREEAQKSDWPSNTVQQEQKRQTQR